MLYSWYADKGGFSPWLKARKKRSEKCASVSAKCRFIEVVGVKIERKICKRLQNGDDDDKLPVFGSVKR